MTWNSAFAQSRGWPRQQEDQGGVWGSRDALFAVLCDGAGGHARGADAAAAVVGKSRELWDAASDTFEARTLLSEVCRSAHDILAGWGAQSYSPRSTFLGLLLNRGGADWAHSGDTRLYHFADGRLVSQTRDHSVAQVLVDKGELPGGDADCHPDRSTLLQSLGGAEYIPPEMGSTKLGGDDVFVLCTDGVWAEVTRTELSRVALSRPQDRPAAATALVDAAVARGGRKADNATLIVIWRNGEH